MSSAPPSIAASWSVALATPAVLDQALARWIPGRRWFAAKDLGVQRVGAEAVVPLTGDVALVAVRVELSHGADDQRYAVPLALVGSSLAPPDAVVATATDGVVVDAMALEDGARVVVTAALRAVHLDGRAASAVGTPRRPGLDHLLAASTRVQVLTAEQSNSSVVLGGEVIGKLVRRLAVGTSPDVSMPEHLRAAGFAHVPGVVGTLDVDLDGCGRCTAVVVHDAVEHRGDLWEAAQTVAASMIADRVAGRPVSLDAVTPVVDRLARRTAEMHAASGRARPSRGPEPSTLTWQADLLDELAASLAETQQALGRTRADLPADAATGAGALLDHGDRLLARFDALRGRSIGGARIRIHGDLHLGQVLWTGDDVVFIDFEGEPARSIAEREMTRSPLADVAGMLRSFDYAGRVALAAHGPVGDGPSPLDDWRRQVTDELQERFWVAYREAADAELIPADRRDARALLDVHVALKALYEVRYELAHRPQWVAWPLAALAGAPPSSS